MNTLYKTLLVAILILSNGDIFPQYYEWLNISSGVNIRKVAKQGNFIWTATEAGLVKFDITNTKRELFNKTNSGLKTNRLTTVMVDQAGNKWIGTNENGLYKFNDTTWTNFSTTNSPLPSDNIQTVIEDTSHTLWIGTLGGGLVRYFDGSWTVYNSGNTSKPVDYIYSLAADKYGYLWVGTSADGILRFDGSNEWVMFNTDNTPVLKSNTIRAIAVDSQGLKWFGTESGDDGGLYKFDGSQFTLYPTGSFSRNIYSISFDPEGKVWVASYGGGLAKLEGTSFTVFNTTNSAIAENALKSMLIDETGTKYIGSERKGLIIHVGGSFYKYNMAKLPNNYIFSMATDPAGNKWLGMKNYLIKMNGTSYDELNLADFLTNPTPNLPPNFNVWAMAFDSQGNKWIGTYDGGLVRLSPSNFPTVYNTTNSNIPSNNVYSLVVDNQDRVWVGTASGLAKFDGTTWTIYNTTNSQLPNNYCGSMAMDQQNRLWIATSNGVARFDGVNWSRYFTNNGLPSNFCFYVTVDANNNKWIGTGGGLAKFDGTTWTSYTTSNSGLPANQVQMVKSDTSGNIWAGTGGFGSGYGITKFDGTTWTTFNIANSGISGNSISSFMVDENGNNWIGSFDDGLSLYKPGGVVDVESESINKLDFALGQNYPNPFNPSTTIGFKLDKGSYVKLSVFDITGKAVATPLNGYLDAGVHKINFDATYLPSGVYLYRLESGNRSDVRKMMLIK
ncbi:MAG: T9SS type A sorting domain-containing protein [Ignavibacteriales bacterium]|nr:T9SS type A sorting domain-containing protein [Ignavibacteriales bacterium]